MIRNIPKKYICKLCIICFFVFQCIFMVYIHIPGVYKNSNTSTDIINTISTLEQETKFILMQNSRLDLVEKVCNQKNWNGSSLKDKTTVLEKSAFWLVKEHIIYCPIFKSASSTWLKNLINISRSNASYKSGLRKSNKPLIEEIESVAKRPTSDEWELLWSYIKPIEMSRTALRKSITSFIVVRHPFERLVSAYRDKLERTNKYYYQLYGIKIVKMFRNKAIEKFGEKYFAKENNYGAILKPDPNDPKARHSSSQPSFWEFVQAVISGEIDDGHWRPQYKFCSVCHNFQIKTINYILKFENMDEEALLFLKHLKLDKMFSSVSNDKLNSNRPSNLSSTELTRLYFSTLSASDVTRLYNIYKPDFVLFNYTFQIDGLRLPILDE